MVYQKIEILNVGRRIINVHGDKNEEDDVVAVVVEELVGNLQFVIFTTTRQMILKTV